MKKEQVNIRPIGDRVVLKRAEAKDVTPGGIVIPESAKEKPLDAVVVAVGPGKPSKDGTGFVEPEVKPGDKVLLAKWAGTEVDIDGIKHVIVPESNILGVYDR